jgi:hypothetical protein
MHEHGVNMEVRGAIYLNTGKDGAPQLHSSVTPLMIAQSCAAMDGEEFNPEVISFLRGIRASAQPEKRQRTSVSTYDRAMSLGIAHKLREIPTSLQTRIESGSDAEMVVAKKELHSIQKANQKVVARAEQQQLKQTKLVFTVQH